MTSSSDYSALNSNYTSNYNAVSSNYSSLGGAYTSSTIPSIPSYEALKSGTQDGSLGLSGGYNSSEAYGTSGFKTYAFS